VVFDHLFDVLRHLLVFQRDTRPIVVVDLLLQNEHQQSV
jgi:hypothetical protein